MTTTMRSIFDVSTMSQFVLFILLLPVVHVVHAYTCDGYNDTGTVWPGDDKLIQLGQDIQGTVVLPGSPEYAKAGLMKDLVYSTRFGAIVYPESAADVQKILKFASDNNIRPTVVSSGHDYIGRSAGENTLSINMTKFDQISVNTADSSSPTGKSVTVGPGTIWIDIYTEVDKYKLVVVGGSAHTVSPSGYTMGGGHSPITRTLGLSVDNTLQFTIVTPQGKIITVTESGGTITNTDGSTEALNDGGDLWWSVLGGGGGVFGVVTEFKFKAHDPPTDGFVRMSMTYPIYWYNDPVPCVGVATQVLQKFFTMMKDGLSANWGGYVLLAKPRPEDPNKGKYGGLVTFFFNHWGGDIVEAMASVSELTSFRTDCQYGFPKVNWVKYNTFLDYERTMHDPIYVRNAIAGRLLHDADLTAGSGLAEVLTEVNNVPSDYAGCTMILVGGAANVPSPDKLSVSPEWRTAKLTYACGAGWTFPSQDSEFPYKLADYAKAKLYPHGKGVYYNEAGYFIENWKTEYWGTMERYNRLLRTKQKWDPDNMFWCHHCVGSDLVTYTSDEICPTPFGPRSAANPTSGFVSVKLSGVKAMVAVLFCI